MQAPVELTKIKALLMNPWSPYGGSHPSFGIHEIVVFWMAKQETITK